MSPTPPERHQVTSLSEETRIAYLERMNQWKSEVVFDLCSVSFVKISLHIWPLAFPSSDGNSERQRENPVYS